MAQPLTFVAPEELARANLYGLIARLFYAPPDEQLISEMVRAQPMEGDGDLAKGWRDMAEACRSAFPVTLEHEHTELFIGTGKAEVTPYLSRYVMKYSTDNPLVELRQQLVEWGIGRREEVAEYEDHISGVCETMRFVIAVQQRSAEEQRAFFERFVYAGAIGFCSAVSASKNARFYQHVARFSRAFFDIEKTAFEMVG
ncbi:MAG TPA: molecular chaperone TorD family protein [Burkholderiales bacterium]|jgi:TorA maturation chaperone TorD